MWDKIATIFTGDRFSSECALLRYVRGTIKDYEDKFHTQLDMGLILSTIFYGYDQQAHYRNYKTTESAENADYTEAAEHYKVLLNRHYIVLLKQRILKLALQLSVIQVISE